MGTVVLGYQFLFEEGSDAEGCLLHPLHVNRLGSDREKEDPELFTTARNVSCNLKMLSQAAAASGFFNVSPDPDGILRRVPLIIEYKGRFYPSLALATLMRALNMNEVLLKTGNSGAESLWLNQTAIPLTSKGNMLVRFRGKGKTFEYFSAADILSDRIPKEKDRRKNIVRGNLCVGNERIQVHPFRPYFPGLGDSCNCCG